MYSKQYLQGLWIKISRDHDRHAYNQFFDYFYPRLFKFSLQFVKLPSIAQEVVSDVIYNVLKDRSRMKSIESISDYLLKAVKNKSLNYLSKQMKTPVSQNMEEAEDYLIQEPLSEELIGSDQYLMSLLSTIINQLPRQRQMVYKLIREEGCTVDEVAEMLGISQRTVEKHLELAIKSICSELKEHLQDQRHHPKIRKMFPRIS